MHKSLFSIIDFITQKDGIGNKAILTKEVQEKFGLTRDRSVYYSKHYAIRFSSSASTSFSNTVISLSALQKYDELPFLVCLVSPQRNFLYLANSTFLHKVSHSSQQLRIDNIRGSINGSDIAKEFCGIGNSPENFEKLFGIHAEIGFEGNLPRLVEATNSISPSGTKFIVSKTASAVIKKAPQRAIEFVNSPEYSSLKQELDKKVKRYQKEILIAGFIENVNLRGRIIEYLIAGEDETLRLKLLDALRSGVKEIPKFSTKNDLGDYVKNFDNYHTATDIKTKIMVLHSNPKAYNIDKMLEFLSQSKSVFMFYFIGIEPNKIVNQVLLSMFQVDLLDSTILLKHWAGRNSRGVTQFDGTVLGRLIPGPNNKINPKESELFLKNLIQL